MDIASLLQTYGGLGGLGALALGVAIQSRKWDGERRAELREDIDREQADNTRLREDLAQESAKRISAELERDQERAKRIALEDQLRILHAERGEGQ